MQGDQVANSIQFILNSELSGVLSKGFAQLYQKKPNFPVSYLANWLKQYSKTEKDKVESTNLVNKQRQAYTKLEEQKIEAQKNHKINIKRNEDAHLAQDQKYVGQIQKTKHLEDLLTEWIPQYIQNRYQLTGCYIGNLTHPHKPLQIHNFEPGAELDTQAPKVIEYVGTSKSHKPIMHMKILPAQTGVTYDVFNQPQPQPQGEEAQEGQQKKVKEPKKTYLYIPDVTKNEKIYYFKYPRLGSYAIFPLKLKSYLSQNSFDQGVQIYKQNNKQQQETKKQYSDKLNEAKNEYQQAKKKYQQFEVPEQQPNPDAETQKNSLKEQFERTEVALNELTKNAPQLLQPDFPAVDKLYMVGIDTLGQDKKITEDTLNKIQSQVLLFKKKFQKKQRNLLMKDITCFISDQNKAQQLQNAYKQMQKNAISHAEEVGKQKTTKQKQLQYQISYAKLKKMEAIFEDPGFEKSMEKYIQYNIPKYKQILQIGLMMLGYSKQDINLPRTNKLNHRKICNPDFMAEFLKKLTEYDLRPEETGQCNAEYKINKMLERRNLYHQLNQVIKYNAFIWALAHSLKGMCWCRMHCKDAHNQAIEFSIKAKQERDTQIINYQTQLQKSLEAHKAELGQNQQGFVEQEWIQNYKKQNPQPKPLEVLEQKQFLDLQ